MPPNPSPVADVPSPKGAAARPPMSEQGLVWIVGAVQFANILDFMMVMPLGPDFSRALGIPTSQLGVIGGTYTAAAALAGLLGMWWLERFDRRKALVLSMLGLAAGTAAGAFATDLPTLVMARALAGFWGGPATSLSMSMIADGVPPERRGRAMGAVMGAFAAASVLGVPAGLELSRQGGWRLPFFAVAVLVLVLAAAAWRVLPSMRGHLIHGAIKVDPRALLSRRAPLLALAVTGLLMASSFTLVPNIASYVQGNMGFPREDLGLMYLLGGSISFFATRLAGRAADHLGLAQVSTAGALLFAAVVASGFFVDPSPLPVPALFVGVFLSMGLRNVPYNTLMTLVPGPRERATFLSLQSAAQHLAASAGAFASSRMLSELPNHRLMGMGKVAVFSMGLTALSLPFLWWLNYAVGADRRRTS